MPVRTADQVGGVALALELLGELGRPDVSLAAMTTYKVGGSADVFVRVTDVDDLRRVAAAVVASGLPVLLVGRGSNLLVSDDGFHGIAVSLADVGTSIDIDEATSTVVAGSAVLLPVLARRSASAGLTGFEWAVGVPGSIGGAVRMNAGGHGSDMAASLLDVVVAELGDGGEGIPRTVPAEELGLRFRGSALPATTAVLSARLQLAPGDRERSEREIGEIVSWRRANQPGGQNAGSVFVNPVPGEVSAGELIDAAGLRGRRRGSATVSEKHANFIQADDGGTAQDVYDLMKEVRSIVLEHSGYALRSEIRLVGFEDPWA